MNDTKIRRRILEMVFERFKEHPYYRITPKEFKETLGISLKHLCFNVAYLAEKGYIDLQTPLEGTFFVGARITVKGIDLVEDELQFDILFPSGQDQRIPENTFSELHLVMEATVTHQEIAESTRELIVEGIKDITTELKRHEPSYNKIRKLLAGVITRHGETGKRISTILKTPEVQKLLLSSARKELEETDRK